MKKVENNGGTVEVEENLIKQLNRIIARVSHASRAQSAAGVEARLDRIEALLKFFTRNASSNQTQKAI